MHLALILMGLFYIKNDYWELLIENEHFLLIQRRTLHQEHWEKLTEQGDSIWTELS